MSYEAHGSAFGSHSGCDSPGGYKGSRGGFGGYAVTEYE